MTLHDYLSELERVEKAATPGPWSNEQVHECEGYIQTTDGCDIAKHEGSFDCDSQNFELIAKSRNALPKLLAIIKVQQEALNRVGYVRKGGDDHHWTIARQALAAVEKIVGGE